MKRTHPDAIEVSGPPPLPASPEIVIAALAPLITPARLARIEAVAASRTTDVVPVLEQIHDPHNASAILRTADAARHQRHSVGEYQELAIVPRQLERRAINRGGVERLDGVLSQAVQSGRG